MILIAVVIIILLHYFRVTKVAWVVSCCIIASSKAHCKSFLVMSMPSNDACISCLPLSSIITIAASRYVHNEETNCPSSMSF